MRVGLKVGARRVASIIIGLLFFAQQCLLLFSLSGESQRGAYALSALIPQSIPLEHPGPFGLFQSDLARPMMAVAGVAPAIRIHGEETAFLEERGSVQGTPIVFARGHGTRLQRCRRMNGGSWKGKGEEPMFDGSDHMWSWLEGGARVCGIEAKNETKIRSV